jgi:hypothetical protein
MFLVVDMNRPYAPKRENNNDLSQNPLIHTTLKIHLILSWLRLSNM